MIERRPEQQHTIRLKSFSPSDDQWLRISLVDKTCDCRTVEEVRCQVGPARHRTPRLQSNSWSSTNHETDRGSPEAEVALVKTIDEVAAECPQIAKVAAHTDVVVEESHGAKAKVPSPIVAGR